MLAGARNEKLVLPKRAEERRAEYGQEAEDNGWEVRGDAEVAEEREGAGETIVVSSDTDTKLSSPPKSEDENEPKDEVRRSS